MVPLHTYRFLVVDDDAINRHLMTTILRRFTPNVAAVSDGEQALLAVAEHDYDIVFMDIHMPVMGGIEAMLAMKSALPPERLPTVVALTGSSDEHTLQRCHDAGMADHIIKPADLGTVRMWLENWERTQTGASDDDGLLNMARIRELKDLEGSASTEAVVAELISLFRTECPVHIAELKDALETGDSERAIFLSHKLKGSLLNLGLHAAADVCAQIENRVGSSDVVVHLKLINQLEDLYARSYAEFAQYLRSA